MTRGTLLAGHGLGGGTLHLLSLLHQGAEHAERLHQAVHAGRALDALGLADLAPDLGAGPDADRPQGGQDGVAHAALAHLLGVLAGRHARNKVRENTRAEVVEAPAQTVGPLTHGDA